MSREIIHTPDRKTWLAKKAVDLTSTDAASLCGVGRKTRFMLWTEKHKMQPVAIEETEAMRLGKILEAPIAQHLATEHGFDIEPFKDYIRIPELRMGSSFDWRARDRSFLLEIKLVGPHQFREGWAETDFGLEAPLDIEAQVQQEMLVAEIPLCFIGVLCGTQTYLLRREFDQAVSDRLQREAAAFWTAPEPEPDWQADVAFIATLCRQATPGKVLQADADVTQLLAEYDAAATARRVAEDAQDAAKARLLMAIGDAEKVVSEIGTLSCGTVKAAQVSYERGEYRRFSFYPKRSTQ